LVFENKKNTCLSSHFIIIVVTVTWGVFGTFLLSVLIWFNEQKYKVSKMSLCTYRRPSICSENPCKLIQTHASHLLKLQ
jgi:hypothetical protein